MTPVPESLGPSHLASRQESAQVFFDDNIEPFDARSGDAAFLRECSLGLRLSSYALKYLLYPMVLYDFIVLSLTFTMF